MSQPPKSRSSKAVRRRIDLDADDGIEIYSRSSREALIQELKDVKQLLSNTVGEMRVQENRMNECVIIATKLYTLVFGLVAEYSAALWWNDKVNATAKPLPPAWFASRVQDFAEKLFEEHDLKGLQMRPAAHLVAGNVFISKKKVNPGSKLHQALSGNEADISERLIRAAFIELMSKVPLPLDDKDRFVAEVLEDADTKKEV